MRAALLPGGAVLLLLAAAAPAAPLPDSPVAVVALNFVPPAAVAVSGGSVAWTSYEPPDIDHFIVGPGFFGYLPPGATLRLAISAPAGSVVTYVCGIHPVMVGKLVVV